jgi:hypothetical protein
MSSDRIESPAAPGSTGEAIERLRLYFAATTTRQGILARQALGEPAPGDNELAQRLVNDMRAEARMDGSIAGAVVPTIWRAHELLDLGCYADQMGVMGWVFQLQGRPGAFSEGCTPPRHAHRACQHYISGFFSPAPPEQRLTPVMLPNGKVFRGEPAARFAISCMALRAALRGRMDDRPTVGQHVISLLQLQEQWEEDWDGYFSADAIVSGIHALAFAPGAQSAVLPKLTAILVRNQAADGTWPNADLFHTLETLEALNALGSAEAHAAMRRSVPALLARQRIDGSFGATAQQERALIGLRSLLWSEREI